MLSASRGGLEVCCRCRKPAGDLPVQGRVSAGIQEQPGGRSACAASLVAGGDRPAGDHRSGHERAGKHALSVRDVPRYRVFRCGSVGEVVARRVSLRSVLARKLLAEAGYPNGFDLNCANTAQARGSWSTSARPSRHVDRRGSLKLTNYEWGSFAPLILGDQAKLVGGASMFGRWPAGRAMALRRVLCRGERPASDRRQELCDATCQDYQTIERDLLAERDPVKRTALIIRHGGAGRGLHLDDGADHRGHGLRTRSTRRLVGQFAAIPGRHELGDVFERITPRRKPWPNRPHEAVHRPAVAPGSCCCSWWRPSCSSWDALPAARSI